MKRTLTLATRNLLRNRRRSLTTLMAVIIGTISILMFGGYVRNIIYGLESQFVTQSGHLQIQHKDYFLYGDGNPAAYGVADYQGMIDTIKADRVLAPLLAVVTPMLQVGGVAGNFAAGLSRTVIGSGMVVADQNQLRLWNDYNFPQVLTPLALDGTSTDSAVIGTGVARVLQLCQPLKVENCPGVSAAPAAAPVSAVSAVPPDAQAPDDIAALSEQERAPVVSSGEVRIELLAPTPRGAPNVAQLKVVKAEEQGVKELDDIFIALHLSQAQRLVYGSGTPKVTAIIVQLKHTTDIPLAHARLNELLAGPYKDKLLTVLTFDQINPFFGQTIKMFDVIFGFISVLIGVIVLFMLGNTMSMTVAERTVEIGTLRAIGLRRNGIRNLFVAEGLLLGTLGVLIAIGVSILVSLLINQSGFTWIPPGRMTKVPLTVRVLGEYRLMLGSAVGLMLVSALSAWWPARHAARMNIVDALRHV
ncbi:MAG: ABC transporter permease [Rhodoferax sp.]